MTGATQVHQHFHAPTQCGDVDCTRADHARWRAAWRVGCPRPTCLAQPGEHCHPRDGRGVSHVERCHVAEAVRDDRH